MPERDGYEWQQCSLPGDSGCSPVTWRSEALDKEITDPAAAPPRPNTDLRRSSTITQTLKNGVSELRSMGRRMSLSIRGKNSKHKEDLVDVSMAQFLSSKPSCPVTDSKHEFSDRPKSRGSWLRTPSTRRRPSLPLLNFATEPIVPTQSTAHYSSVAGTTMPILPDYVFGGDGARAAAAAQNEAFQAARTPSLPPYTPGNCAVSDLHLSSLRIDRDSESGIGIVLDVPTRQSSVANHIDVMRCDPSFLLMTEVMEQVLAYLDVRSVLQASIVSRKWRQLCFSQAVWRQVFLREYTVSQFPSTPTFALTAGLGKRIPGQDYRKLYQIRTMIEKRWNNGEAAAIYLNGHKDSVYCVQFDEKKIITGSRDNTIRVWDAHNYQCIKKLGPPNNTRERVQAQRPEVEPQGVVPFCKMEITSSDPVSPPLTNWHQASVLCLQYDDEILVTGSSDFTCLVWSIKDDYQPLFRLVGHLAGVLDVCIDQKHIVTCSKDTTIKIWDRSTGQCLNTLRGHRGPVNAVQVRGNFLASASGDGMSKLWRLEDGVCVKEFQSKDRGLACVEFSEDGRTIFAGGNDQVIYEYDTITGTKLRELKGHKDLVRSLHIDSANSRIVSGSYDHSIKVWDAKRGESAQDGGLKINFEGWTSSWMLAAKSDYRKIVCTSQDGRVVVIDFGWGINDVKMVEA